MLYQRLASSVFVAGVVALTAATTPAANAATNRQDTPTTSAHISCDWQSAAVAARAWGSAYEPNSQVTVGETIAYNGQTLRAVNVAVQVAPAGGWTVPTSVIRPAKRGVYALNVTTTDAAGKPLGGAHDECIL